MYQKSGMGAYAVALVNQVAASGTTFAICLISLRFDTVEQFGILNGVIAAASIWAAVTNSYVADQWIVRKGELDPTVRGGVLFFLLCFVASSSLIVGASFAVLTAGSLTGVYAAILAAIFPVFSLRDFLFRILYGVGNEVKLMFISIASTIVSGLVVGFLYLLKGEEAARPGYGISLLLVVATANSCFAGLLVARINLLKFQHVNRKDLVLVVLGGGSSVLATLGTALRSQAHVVAGAVVGGASGIAILSAARLYVVPILTALPVLGQILLPRLVRDPALQSRRFFRHTFVAVASLAICYTLLLYLAVFLGWVGLPQLEGTSSAVIHWLLFAYATSIGSAARVFLLAQKMYKENLRYSLLATAIVLICQLPTYWMHDLSMILYGMILGELFYFSFVWIRLRKALC